MPIYPSTPDEASVSAVIDHDPHQFVGRVQTPENLLPTSKAHKVRSTGCVISLQPTWRRKPLFVATGPAGETLFYQRASPEDDAQRWAAELSRDNRANSKRNQLHYCKRGCFKNQGKNGALSKLCRFKNYRLTGNAPYPRNRQNATKEVACVQEWEERKRRAAPTDVAAWEKRMMRKQSLTPARKTFPCKLGARCLCKAKSLRLKYSKELIHPYFCPARPKDSVILKAKWLDHKSKNLMRPGKSLVLPRRRHRLPRACAAGVQESAGDTFEYLEALQEYPGDDAAFCEDIYDHTPQVQDDEHNDHVVGRGKPQPIRTCPIQTPSHPVAQAFGRCNFDVQSLYVLLVGDFSTMLDSALARLEDPLCTPATDGVSESIAPSCPGLALAGGGLDDEFSDVELVEAYMFDDVGCSALSDNPEPTYDAVPMVASVDDAEDDVGCMDCLLHI